MIEQTSEVKHAVSTLTAEILKLSPLEGEAAAALGVSIENAFARLVLAMAAQFNESQGQRLLDLGQQSPTEESLAQTSV